MSATKPPLGLSQSLQYLSSEIRVRTQPALQDYISPDPSPFHPLIVLSLLSLVLLLVPVLCALQRRAQHSP